MLFRSATQGDPGQSSSGDHYVQLCLRVLLAGDQAASEGKPEMNTKPSDVIAATVPLLGTVTLGQINDLVGIAGGMLGMAYLIWRWRRDAKQNSNR